MKKTVVLPYDWDRNLDEGLSVPGLSSEIDLIQRCWCVGYDYDHVLDESTVTAKENCSDCGGTGIEITSSGKAILTLFDISFTRQLKAFQEKENG